jgi:tetratricopeptide (TPR) repeat protein
MAKQQQALPAKAHNAMGRCYERLGRYGLAVDQFKKASQMDIGVGVYAANTGLGLVRMGKAEDAIPCLKWAITCDSEDGYPHAVLGDALRLLGREAEAGVEYLEGKKRMETTLRSCPNNKFALNWLADVCLRLGLYEEASTYKRRASEIVRKGHWGAPADDFVAGMASGVDGLVSLRDSSS